MPGMVRKEVKLELDKVDVAKRAARRGSQEARVGAKGADKCEKAKAVKKGGKPNQAKKNPCAKRVKPRRTSPADGTQESPPPPAHLRSSTTAQKMELDGVHKHLAVGIVGGRDFNDYASFCKHVVQDMASLGNPAYTTVVSGGAAGADTLAERWAKGLGLEFKACLPASRRREDLLARNTDIVAASDIVIAFPTAASHGTWDTVRKAKAQVEARGLKLFVHKMP